MTWKPFPENIPTHDGEYIVSIDSNVTIAEFKQCTKLYNESHEKYYAPAWHDLLEGGLQLGVVAFMEKPMPYSAQVVLDEEANTDEGEGL
jgi:hypothetical protein